jgi:hypothetical protein
MNRSAITISITLIFGVFVSFLFACSQDNEKKGEWTAILENGSIITERDLESNREGLKDIHRMLNHSHRLEKASGKWKR